MFMSANELNVLKSINTEFLASKKHVVVVVVVSSKLFNYNQLNCFPSLIFMNMQSLHEYIPCQYSYACI